MPESGTCPKCLRPVTKAIMASSGLPVMLDPEPTDDGDVHILTLGRQKGQVIVLRGPILDESRKDPDCDVHELHVFTCAARG